MDGQTDNVITMGFHAFSCRPLLAFKPRQIITLIKILNQIFAYICVCVSSKISIHLSKPFRSRLILCLIYACVKPLTSSNDMAIYNCQDAQKKLFFEEGGGGRFHDLYLYQLLKRCTMHVLINYNTFDSFIKQHLIF